MSAPLHTQRPEGGSASPDAWHDHRFDTADPCPVCGQPLSPGRGWVIRYNGEWVRFRSGDCVKEFEREPDRYPGA